MTALNSGRLAALLVLVFVPQRADACPVCATNGSTGQAVRWIVVGLFMLLPFVIAGVTGLVMARIVRRSTQAQPKHVSAPNVLRERV